MSAGGKLHIGKFRTRTYLLIIFFCVFGAYTFRIYQSRSSGLFSCAAEGYSADRFLSYCHGQGYGDYEHGAFWFDLEPSATKFAKSADVLFLGDSRMQYGFSSSYVANWLSSLSAPYYLLGFSYVENSVFALALLNKLAPQAKVYIINIERFFEQSETVPAQIVMHDTTAPTRYQEKRLLQGVHKFICQNVSHVCGGQYTVFRSRKTGTYSADGLGNFSPVPVSFEPMVEQDKIDKYISIGRTFLSKLPVAKECVLFTFVPTVKANVKNAEAVASALGVTLISPAAEGLVTFDGSHLDRPSAERWSQAFLKLAGPKIKNCLASGKISYRTSDSGSEGQISAP